MLTYGTFYPQFGHQNIFKLKIFNTKVADNFKAESFATQQNCNSKCFRSNSFNIISYSFHSLLIAIFHLDTMTKKNNLTYHIVNATQKILLVLQCFKWELLVTSVIYCIAHTNSKYIYNLWTFEFLKYIYQKWMEGVFYKNIILYVIPLFFYDFSCYLHNNTVYFERKYYHVY